MLAILSKPSGCRPPGHDVSRPSASCRQNVPRCASLPAARHGGPVWPCVIVVCHSYCGRYSRAVTSRRRRSKPLRVQRLHQRRTPAVVLADLRDERREIGAAAASFVEFGHRRQCRGDVGIKLGVGVPQIFLELWPVQVCSIDRPSFGASVGQFPPRPAGTVTVRGLPRGLDITLAQTRAGPGPRRRRNGQTASCRAWSKAQVCSVSARPTPAEKSRRTR